MIPFTKIKELFFHNLGLKCISIVLGMLLWIYVSNEEGMIKKFKIPINFVNINHDLYLSYCSKDKALITIQGKRENILSCRSSDFSLPLSLSQKNAGTYVYNLSLHKIVGPQNVTIKKIYPKFVKVTLKAKPIKKGEGNISR